MRDVCKKHYLLMVTCKKITEHAGEVWHSNVIESGAHDNFPHSEYGQKQKKEGRHQKIELLTGERTRKLLKKGQN
jgi:hypothetical protein